LVLFTHPQWHLVFGYYIIIIPTYILIQIELEAKGYGIKKSVTIFMNQLSCTLDVIIVLEYTSQGKVLLLSVSKKNFKPSSWCTLKIVENGLEMRNLPPQSKGGREFTKKPLNHWTLQRPALKHPKSSFYVALLL